MGNTPSAAKKRSRTSNKSSGGAKKSPDESPPRKKQAISQAGDSDDEVQCLTPVKSAKGNTSTEVLKWKPAGGSAKLSASVSKKASTSANTESPTTSQPTTGKKKRSAKIEVPEEPQIELIVTESGPRARKRDGNEYYEVESVVEKWIGPSDYKKRDTFYLLQFKGQPKPKRNAGDDFWYHPTQMIDCEDLIEEMIQREELKKEERNGRRKNRFWTYAEESEDSEKSDNDEKVEEEEEDLVGGKSLRKRQKKEDGAAETPVPTGRKKKKVKEEEEITPVLGFENGKEPEKIIASTHFKRQLLYVVQYAGGCDEVDYVVSTICHEKCPELVLDFLVSKLQNVPVLTRKQMGLE